MSVSTPSTGEHESVRVVIAAMVLGSAAYFGFQLAPILLNGLLQAGRLSENGVGQAAMFETFAVAIGSFIGPSFLNGGRLRVKTAAACGLLILVNLSMTWADSQILILIHRAVAGLCAGVVAASANLILTYNRRPAFMGGLMTACVVLPLAAAGYLLPAQLIPHLGINSAYVALAAVVGVAMLFTPILVDRVKAALPDDSGANRAVLWTPALLIVIAAIILHMGGVGALWNYLAVLAAQRGVSDESVGIAFAGTQFVSFVALLTGSWVCERIRSTQALILGAVAEGAIVLGLLYLESANFFVAAVWAIGAFSSMHVWFVSELVRVDPSRKTAVLMNPIGQVGLSSGPLVASYLIRQNDIEPAYWGAVGLFSAATLLYIIVTQLPVLDSDQGEAASKAA